MEQATTTKPKPTYADLQEENRFLRHANKNLEEDKAYLEELIRYYTRLRFAPTSEIYSKGQGTLFNECEFETDEADDEQEESGKPKKGKKRGKPKRKPLPKDLPRIENLIDIPESEKVCPHTGQALVRIGEEVSEQLDIEPAKASVIRTVRPKYACPCPVCTGKADPMLTEADVPEADLSAITNEAKGEPSTKDVKPTFKVAPIEAGPIPKSMASAGLLAYIVTAKYADGLPLYRQIDIFKRLDIELDRTTLARWMIRCGELVQPLINLMRDFLLDGPIVYADETKIKVLKGTGKKPTATSYMWVFMRTAANEPKVILYELGPSRSHTVPLSYLSGYTGYVHADGYEAYETMAERMEGVTLVGDWVHVRRKFAEAVKAVAKDYKGEVKAKVGLELINRLFKLERELGDDASPGERYKMRQKQAKPIVDELKEWVDKTAPTVPPKTLTGKALNYLIGQWPKLSYFLDEPLLRLDTNPVENAIRPFVIGRKGWLFADTKAGGDASAALYSLMITAKANGLNEYKYLKAVFTDLPKATTIKELEALLPWNFKPTP